MCDAYTSDLCFDILYTAHKYGNFTVGLTNVSPAISTPILWNYVVCGQYPGAVRNGATVSLNCRNNLPPFRYVIVQIPSLRGHFVACEIEVLVRGTKMLNSDIYHSSRQLSMLLFFIHIGECLPIVLHDLGYTGT